MFVDILWLDTLLRGLILALLALAWVVLLVRINGLRSLSKMTSFDFIMTVAQGSLVAGATQTTEWQDFAQVLAGMASLFVAQWAGAKAIKSSDTAQHIMTNKPVVLMRDGRFCEEALNTTRVARSSVMAKLREANVRDLSQVRAVVLETTGDVSVLHGDTLSSDLLEGVEGSG